MRNVFGDKRICRKRHLQLRRGAAAGGGHYDDVLAAECLDRRLHQPAKIGVVDGALGYMHDGSMTVEFVPPWRRPEAVRWRWMDGADVAHVGGQVATRIVELRDGRRDVAIREQPG